MDLRRFGLTSTETRVYLALLEVAPATGYGVARQAGLARANAYGALERLASRGFASKLPGRPARYAAAEPAVLTARLERDWKRDIGALTEQLASARRGGARPVEPPVESVADRADLLARIAACAISARQELLAVVGPWAADCYEAFARVPEERATARLLSLGTPAPAGSQVREVPAREISAYWGGFPVAVVSDRRSAVLGLFADDGTATGIATSHPAVVPFVRHLLRRELASAGPQRVS